MTGKTIMGDVKFQLNRKVEILEWDEMKNKSTIQKIKSRNSPYMQSENMMQ